MRCLVTLFLATLSLNTVGQVPNYVPSDGLEAWYFFTGNANDESGNGNIGEVIGATLTTDRNGNMNSAYSFDGVDDHISLNINLGNFGVSDFTISAWQLKTDTNLVGAVFGKRNSMGDGNMINFDAGPGYEISTGGGDYVANSYPFQVEDIWFHSVLIREGLNISVYLNGVLVGNEALTSIHDINNTAISEIGARWSGATIWNLWNGKIDDVGIWNRVLSEEEIQELYLAEPSVSGCTDSLANNYNPEVTLDDGTCCYLTIAQNDTIICEGDSVSLNVTGASQSIDLQNGLVAYYPFNGNANDESGNGNHGTVNEATLTSDRFGNSSSAFTFGGDGDYINIGNDESLNRENTSFSIHTWINFNNYLSTSFPSQQAVIISNRPSTYFYGTMFALSENGKLEFGTGDGNDALTPALLSTNQWYNVCVTHDNATHITNLYIDGALVYTTTSYDNSIVNVASGDHYIGKETHENLYPFDGEIDDMYLYNRVLTLEEVQELYNDSSGLISEIIWSTGDTTASINIAPTQTTTYWVEQTENGVSCTDTVTVTVLPTTSVITDITVCNSYDWNGTTYTESGTYSYEGESSNSSINISFNEWITIPSWTPTPSYTLSAWVEFPLPSNNAYSWNTLFEKSFGMYHHIMFVYGELGVYSGGSFIGCGFNSSSLPSGAHQVTSASENNETKFYIDGNYVGVSNAVILEPIDIIGNQNGDGTQPIGIIDDVHIWNTALSQQEIQNYINCPPTGSEEGLVGYWNFEEGSGDTVLDLLPNGNDGTIYGATYDTNVPSQSCSLSNGCSIEVLNLTITSCGCTDDQACNFNENAVEDDGSCEYITPVDLGEDITTCGESVTLDAGEGYDSYLWINGETTQSIEVSESGDYSVEVGEGNVNEYSMSFDGVDDYTDLGTNENFLFQDLFSFEAWVKIPLIPVGNGAIIGALNSYRILIYAGSANNGALFVEFPELIPFSVVDVMGSSDLRDNMWHHLSVTYDGTQVVLYVDGLVEDSSYKTGNISLLNTQHSFFIGNSTHVDYEDFQGVISNLGLWNISLSQQEVLSHMNCPPTGTEEGLVGYWNFETGIGGTAFDQTENGNNGTINGATWSTETPEQNCSFCSSSDEITVAINVCGCTDSEAVNYNIEANQDDGSCCYDINYVNDSNNQSYNDGYSDGEESVICPENICPADLDENGYVSTSDLLIFLTEFGQYCDVLDECGVINGDGSTCADLCGDPVSHEGYDYSTVLIGDQCWFAENCRYLPEVSPSSEGSETSPSYYVNDYQGTDVEEAKATEHYETFGALYNWPAVMIEGLCPASWHVPSDNEWNKLEIELGMNPNDSLAWGWRGDLIGSEMKASLESIPPWDGTNTSGLNFFPGGSRMTNGVFDLTNVAYIWSSTNYDDGGIWRELATGITSSARVANLFAHGHAARCVRD